MYLGDCFRNVPIQPYVLISFISILFIYSYQAEEIAAHLAIAIAFALNLQKMKNKKILIVSHQFLPFISPRTTRWNLLIDELIKRGNEVTVLSEPTLKIWKRIMRFYTLENKQISSSISKVSEFSRFIKQYS
ncbi:hypothetical protein CM15mP35_10010 [bacterium]|nr:MAG: hypothetical protein CM15mP35_10010 [bacterium]